MSEVAYTAKEIAHMEGVLVGTVYEWIRTGVLVARARTLRRGKRYRIMQSDYEKFSRPTDSIHAAPANEEIR